MEEEYSFAQEPVGGYLTLSVDLYVDLGAIPNNQYPAGIAVERMLDVLARENSAMRNGDLVLRGKVIGKDYVAYIDKWDKATVHIRIVSSPDGACLVCVTKRMLEALAKAIGARLDDVKAATY
jgi:translation initiation factor 2 beta subunit (eIF-2beta)/eIF-5